MKGQLRVEGKVQLSWGERETCKTLLSLSRGVSEEENLNKKDSNQDNTQIQKVRQAAETWWEQRGYPAFAPSLPHPSL